MTGAAGTLGTEVVDAFSEGFEVVAADLADFDITDEGTTRAAVVEAAPDLVVNCAAYTNVDGAESDRDTAFAVNATGAGNLASGAEAVGASIVHLSTDYVFDGTGNRPYLEDDPVNPLSAYGDSKLEGERAVIRACRRHLIVRTAWLYGHAGPNFVEKMLELADTQDVLRVVDDQFGTPTNARDLAWLIKELVAAGALGVVNATNAGSCSWHEFTVEILKNAGRSGPLVEPVPTEEFPRPAPRPRYSVLSLERLTTLIGWTPRDWREALAEYIAER